MEEIIPIVGMGATIVMWSDREPATIIQVSHERKRIVLQKDLSIRVDNNGMSELQQYEYESDPNGSIFIATKRKDGHFYLTGTKTPVQLGTRYKYYDFSF